MASCWVIDEPPCSAAVALSVADQGAQRADDVDAEMVVEAPVLGGEGRLDQVVGQLVERDGIVGADAAAADLVAVAVEEDDGDVLGLVELAGRGGLEGGQGQGESSAPRRWRRRSAPSRDDLDEEALEAGDVEDRT